MSDYDPTPESLDRYVSYCRVCRLLMEQYRTIASNVERDPPILGEPSVADLLLVLHMNLAKHLQESQHTPVREAVKAMLNGSLEIVRKSHPEKCETLDRERERRREQLAQAAGKI